MEPRQLRHFLAVAEQLHFGRAAEKLGITQPPLSQSIRALESELGAALFHRTRRSVALSPFGADFLPHAQEALNGIEGLTEIAGQLRGGAAGRLELSFVSTADYSVLPDLVQGFRTRFPGVELSLTEMTSDMQITALAAGRGQAGIIIPHGDDPLPEALDYRRLLAEPLVAAVPESWIAEGRLPGGTAPLPPEAVTDKPLIVFPRRAAPLFHDLVTGYYTARGVRPRVAQQAIQMQTIISLVSAGMGLALVPRSLRNLARAGVCYRALDGDPPLLETGICWRRADVTPTLRNFLELVAEGVAEGG
ncbi:LysR family transcriptional regulator [Pseudooceanicola sp. HF7]|uniref:LysR family transcriptional regulator n=1 Tax=Pseudooceanicola sp. HF7 TaxID=2721560 RepID=UPI0014310978|nr:LysR family transcriptional regulator [Pseudooceanicola sp. HF7]NIZ08786.1 LysR family transcriptional regulator [Pseudooceanicola sp. HF7]